MEFSEIKRAVKDAQIAATHNWEAPYSAPLIALWELFEAQAAEIAALQIERDEQASLIERMTISGVRMTGEIAALQSERDTLRGLLDNIHANTAHHETATLEQARHTLMVIHTLTAATEPPTVTDADGDEPPSGSDLQTLILNHLADGKKKHINTILALAKDKKAMRAELEYLRSVNQVSHFSSGSWQINQAGIDKLTNQAEPVAEPLRVRILRVLAKETAGYVRISLLADTLEEGRLVTDHELMAMEEDGLVSFSTTPPGWQLTTAGRAWLEVNG